MFGNLWSRCLAVAVVVCIPLSPQFAHGETPAANFYKAYYLESESGDFASAAKLYGQVVNAVNVEAALKSRARHRLAVCREEIASHDLMLLMPPETMIYAEVTQPGEQLARLLDTVGLLADTDQSAGGQRTVGVSPILVKELLGLRAAAVAITGFDHQTKMPSGVAVLNPGNLEVIRGLLQTVLPAATKFVDATAGQHTYFIPEAHLYACLTARLIIVSPDRGLIDGVLKRIEGSEQESLASAGTMSKALAGRDGSLAYFCADASKLMPLLMEAPDLPQGLAQARAILDLDSLQWIAARAGVDDRGIYFEAAVRMAEGHHNLAYNLVRTPPISSETLSGIPKGVAGFLAGAMNDPGAHYSRPADPGDQLTVTGLDIGRELFANVKDFAVFALPPAADGRTEGCQIPDLAAVIRVNEPARSEALWTQILGIASLASGAAASTNGTTERFGDIDARAYQFPDGIRILVGTKQDRLFMATTPYALRRAAAAAFGEDSILDDKAFAASLKSIDKYTSKVLFLNPGRCLQIAQRFMGESERMKTAPFIDMLSGTVASVRTSESPREFRLSADISGLPNLGPVLTKMIEQHAGRHHRAHEVESASRDGDWSGAIRTANQIIAEGDNPEMLLKEFEILALQKRDRSAALDSAQDFINANSNNAKALNNFAWDLLTNEEYRKAYDRLALKIATKACEASDFKSWALVDTLALARFRAGEIVGATNLQRRAIELYGGDHAEMNQSLAKYLAAHDGE